MRLTQWTDYSLRVLMFCAATQERAGLPTVGEIAQAHSISRSHLTKIVQDLSARGYLETTRGRGGGMRLMRPAKEINVGAVVRATESDFVVVECFDPENNQCRLSSHCRLQSVLGQAMLAFFAVLDALTLEDLMAPVGQAAPSAGVIPIALVPGLPRPVD